MSRRHPRVILSWDRFWSRWKMTLVKGDNRIDFEAERIEDVAWAAKKYGGML